MPADTINNLVLTLGLTGGFVPDSIARLGTPPQDVPVGIAPRMITPGGATRRMFAGRFTADLTEDAYEASVLVGLHNFSIVGAATGGTWSGGGDLNGNTTAAGPNAGDHLLKVVGIVCLATVTACDGFTEGLVPNVSVFIEDPLEEVVRSWCPVWAPEGSPLPTESAPHQGVFVEMGNQRVLVDGASDLDGTGSERLRILVTNYINGKATVDVIFIVAES